MPGCRNAQPPGWVFSVVLFVLVGAVGLLIWARVREETTTDARYAMAAWAVLTVSLASWWPLFRASCRRRSAFAAVLFIAAVAVVTSTLAWRAATRLGAILLLPLVAWLVFASVCILLCKDN